MPAALEEVPAQIRHIQPRLLEQGERRRGRLAQVHRAVVLVAEDHLLVEVVDAATVVADVGVDGVVLHRDEVVIELLLRLCDHHR